MHLPLGTFMQADQTADNPTAKWQIYTGGGRPQTTRQPHTESYSTDCIDKSWECLATPPSYRKLVPLPPLLGRGAERVPTKPG